MTDQPDELIGVAHHIQMLDAAVLQLKNENLRLKWIVAQLMQRYGKDMVLFHMDNPAKFAISVKEQPEKRLIDVRIKRQEEKKDDEPADPPREEPLN